VRPPASRASFFEKMLSRFTVACMLGFKAISLFLTFHERFTDFVKAL
jgi:preprotein translocase subunit SecG